MYKFNDSLKLVQGLHNCKKCIHLPVCIFHEKMRELAKSDLMYRMTEYLEWNNVLSVFEEHASCRFYELIYPMPNFGESINLKCDPEIITHIIRVKVKEIQENVLNILKKDQNLVIVDERSFFYSPDIKTYIDKDYCHLKLMTTNKEIGKGTVVFETDLVISEILKEWKAGKVE